MRRRTGTLVGRAVASVANLLDLRLAVVAGSVALGYGDAFFAAAQAELDARARIEFARGARIVPAGLGDAGPLVGAAAVGWRGEGATSGVALSRWRGAVRRRGRAGAPRRRVRPTRRAPGGPAAGRR